MIKPTNRKRARLERIIEHTSMIIASIGDGCSFETEYLVEYISDLQKEYRQLTGRYYSIKSHRTPFVDYVWDEETKTYIMKRG